MSAADSSASNKLRDLHAEYTGCPNPDAPCLSCTASIGSSLGGALPDIIAVIEAAEKFVADVDDATDDDPGGSDAYIRVGARWFISHDTEFRDALAALNARLTSDAGAA